MIQIFLKRKLRCLAGLPLIFLLAGCQSRRETRAIDGEMEGIQFKLETVAGKLVVPWAVAFAPDGRIFITERPGRIRVVEGGKLRNEPWAKLDVDTTGGEDGLMGKALAPDFAKTGHLYVVGTFSAGDHLVNRVVRFADREGFGVEANVVIDNIPGGRIHAGDAIAFGPDGMLFVATGDVREPNNSQDLNSLAGKLLRYRPDGTIPADNPFPGSPVYAYGLRNVQGLSWQPETHQLFTTEHGPSGFSNEGYRTGHDRLNVIRAGGNYGWPIVAGMNKDPRFIPPIADWTPAIAPSGMAFYTGSQSSWKGNIFVGVCAASNYAVWLLNNPRTRLQVGASFANKLFSITSSDAFGPSPWDSTDTFTSPRAIAMAGADRAKKTIS